MQNVMTLTNRDKISRYTLSAIMLLLVLGMQSMPAWIALIASYLTLSAIVGREPLHSVVVGVARLVPRPALSRGRAHA